MILTIFFMTTPHKNPHDQYLRKPASLSEKCADIFRNFKSRSELKTFDDIKRSVFDRSLLNESKLQNIESHEVFRPILEKLSNEQREKHTFILALLKNKSPEVSAENLLKKYHLYFRVCGL